MPEKRTRAAYKVLQLQEIPRRLSRIRSSSETLDMVEAVLDPSGAPVISMYLNVAFVVLMQSWSLKREFKLIRLPLLGVPSVIACQPGLSQIELAEYMGTTRSAAGKQVSACIRRGWIRRKTSSHDQRRYSLFLTPKGRKMLQSATAVIPEHERVLTESLTPQERLILRRLLRKIIVNHFAAPPQRPISKPQQ